MDNKNLKGINQLDELTPFLHAMFDDSMENVAVHNLDFVAIYMNPTLKKTLGIKSIEDHELIKLSHKAAFHVLFAAIKQVIDTGLATELIHSTPQIHSSRDAFDQIYINPIRNHQGELIGICTVGRDMRLFESQLIVEEKQHGIYLRALLDTFPFMVWMKDKQGRFLEVNQKISDTVHVSEPKYLIGKTDFDYFPKEMAQGYVDDDNEVLKSRQSKVVQEQIQKADGGIYWAETYKSPVTIDGEVIGTVGFAIDITEKQQLIAEINKKSTEYQSLVEHLPMTVIRYDTDCRRIFINDQYKKLHRGALNFELDQTPNQQWHPNITNLTGEQYTQLVREVIQTGIPRDFEINTRVDEDIQVSTVKLVPEFDNRQKVTGAIAIIQDITEKHFYQEKIKYLAYYDSITQLPNRSHFHEKLHQALGQCKEDSKPLCVLMLDLDHFKSINDELGHSVGDFILKEVAMRVKSILSPNMLLARLGGDEFAILMTDYTSIDEINDLAHEIISVMASPFALEETEAFLSTSVGIASYPEHADNKDDLMKFADTAMYLAKKQGRNNFQFFVSGINVSNALSHLVRTELRHAIEREEFYIEYQPIFDIQSNQIIKLEALLRWKSPTLGFVGPDKFIPIAEEYGLINEIGNWVILRACRDAVSTNQKSIKQIQVAINLSPRQFVRNNLVENVRICLSISNCPQHLLEFEITEGLLMESSTEITNTLDHFHQQGIALAIDDFGTGYSSLSYLNKFPISAIKIDRSFIGDITTDEKDAALTKAMINMAMSLGKSVTAEGIETLEQLQLLQAWGCHDGQGFYLGRPQRLESILETIAQHQNSPHPSAL